MEDSNAILKDTKAYGFEFAEESVSEKQGNTSIEVGKGPILIITNPGLFDQKFPGRIVAMLNGSSPRVISQRVVRDAWTQYRSEKAEKRGPKPDMESLKPRVLNAILGVKSRGPVVVERKVYVLPDQSTTDNEAEFRKAWGLPEE